MYYIFKKYLFVFTFLFIVFLFFLIYFPHETFAMEPTIVKDYYGQKQYIGTYTDFHHSAVVLANTDIIESPQNYGSAINVDDWYDNKKETDYMHSGIIIPNKYSNIYHTVKRRIFWYIWKIHSDDYFSYKDFKKSWDPSSSIRKEILRDLRSEFNYYKKR